ncbi:peptidase inhibitor family I36 protein [Gryllotalpicola reticulitermitis]|uniref:Peptidase inhibitor family I36 protein n=1 Tax=Gryllotalpicola reticulitermitis TaxID=1184153 RepID=A0ABV8Q5N7_9MICO
MKRSSRSLLGAATALAIVVGGVLAAAPANAAAPSSCTSGRACLWDNANYKTANSTGNLLWFVQYVDDARRYTYSNTKISAHDSANSAFNNGRTDAAYFWEHEQYRGLWFKLARGQGDSDFGNGVPGRADGYFNNRVDSAAFESIHRP